MWGNIPRNGLLIENGRIKWKCRKKPFSQYMLKAFDQRFPVTIQLRNHTTGCIASSFYHGKVMGFQEDNVVLSDNTQEFPMTDIF